MNENKIQAYKGFNKDMTSDGFQYTRKRRI